MITSDFLQYLTAKGFLLFPLIPNGKIPAVTDFTGKATADLKILEQWFSKTNHNVGISTHRFIDGSHPVVVDVDTKEGKKGDETVLTLELDGKTLPPTLTQTTASGGKHYIYRSPSPLRGGVNKLGVNVDVKAYGGYIVGAGSTVDGRLYRLDDTPIAPAPEWLLSFLSTPKERAAQAPDSIRKDVDQNAALKRAKDILATASAAIEGQGGNATTFAVAARLKDEGLDERTVLRSMLRDYNPRCEPPWEETELHEIVRNAFKYGVDPAGIKAPEVMFKDVAPDEADTKLSPLEEMNKKHAYIVSLDTILWETADDDRTPKLEFLTSKSFKTMYLSRAIDVGGGAKLISDLWMKSPERRTFTGLKFDPHTPKSGKYFNMWKGFSVAPLSKDEEPTVPQITAVERIKEHIFENICGKDDALAAWFTTYFAHLVQRPWEKPLVAVSLFGGKGVGKTAIVKWIGALLGISFLSTAQRRSLLGNFNSHLEQLLLFCLEEAFWSGDKQAEGVLKDLITGDSHLIERKGFEPYTVKNYLRLILCSNEPWSFPSSGDERRLAAFEVGDGKKQNSSFFQSITDGLEGGGYRLLLRYLLDYDISKVDINTAPKTKILLVQKEMSLDLFGQFWLECLDEGCLAHSPMDSWNEQVSTKDVQAAFNTYLGGTKTAYNANAQTVGRGLKLYCPSAVRKRARSGEAFYWVYKFPPLAQAREEWDLRQGQPREWGEL